MSEHYIDTTLYTGRPENCQNRLPKEIRTYDLLDQLDIPYCRVDHDALDTIADCQDVDRLLGIEICKNLFLCNTQKTNFYLYLTSGERKFKTSVFSKLLGCSRLSFAGAEFLEKYLDITPGSVSVLGLMNDKQLKVRLVIDQDILEAEYFGCHPCINTSSLKLKTSDIIEKFLPYTGHEYTVINIEENRIAADLSTSKSTE